MKTYLNVGCGSRFHPAWTNVDRVCSNRTVLYHDLRRGLPFADEGFEVVYHSHVIEHLTKEQARDFLSECLRVLKTGGIIRIAAPNLEQIAKEYLRALDAAARGDDGARNNYEWMMLELYDQTVRERTGGDMQRYLSQRNIANREFVLRRIGAEGRQIMDAPAETPKPTSVPRKSRIRWWFTLIRDSAARREWLTRRLVGNNLELLELGRFRRSGEIHLWMYDRYSLSTLLKDVGFREPTAVGPTESRVAGWSDFNLDTDADGKIYKPDSFYMEALK